MAHAAFEDLPVWRTAMDLAVMIADWIEDGAFRGHPGLRGQMERAVISISNNIAEGFERGTHAELLTFLYYAKGSAAEVRSMLIFLSRAKTWADRRGQVDRFYLVALSVSRQLGAWLRSLRNSDDPGPRHRTDETKRIKDLKIRQATFLEEIRRIQERLLNPENPDPEMPKPDTPN